MLVEYISDERLSAIQMNVASYSTLVSDVAIHNDCVLDSLQNFLEMLICILTILTRGRNQMLPSISQH